MTPNFHSNDRPHERLRNKKTVCDVLLGFLPGGISSANLQHLFGGQSVVGVFFSTISPSKHISALVHHIQSVFLWCSKPKMFWTNTTSIVAAVKNTHSFWNWAKMENPRGPMHVYWRIAFLPFSYFAVSIGILASDPFPTPVCLSDFGPESLLEGWRETLPGKIVGGNLDSCDGYADCFHRAGPGRIIAAPGHFIIVSELSSAVNIHCI